MSGASTSFSVQAGDDSGHVPLAPGVMPQYIQFRFNGVDLGGPDADTVDFVGSGFNVTRGTGANANKITVSFG